MATIKSYTDLEQSKALAEFLPIESADMYWWSSGKRYYIEAIDDDDYDEDKDIRAWSLAALLGLIPQEIFDGEYVINITEGIDNRWVVTYDHCENRNHSYYGLSTGANNIVDACYELVLKLHERKML